MDDDARFLDSSQLLDEVKRAIDFAKPPRTIAICEGVELKANVVSPSDENDNSVDQTASIGTCSFDGIVNGDGNEEEDNQDLLDQVSINVDISERFVIEAANDGDSFPSRVSILEDDEEEGSYEELELVTRTLYKHLQKVDAQLEMERSRRQSREKSLISLAKELVSGKETIAKQNQLIDEIKKELRVEQAEKALLNQRLKHQLFAFNEEQEDICKNLAQELNEARELHEAVYKGYEHRLCAMNESYVKQCENFCREVEAANQQNRLLQDHIDHQTTRMRLLPTKGSNRKERPEAKDGQRTRKMGNWMSLVALLCIIYTLFTSSTSAPSYSSRPCGYRSYLHQTYRNGNGIAVDVGLQPKIPFQTVLDAGDQEKALIRVKSQPMNRLGTRVLGTRVGTKLKNVVIKEDGESHMIRMNNAFLAGKMLDDTGKSPLKSRHQYGKPRQVGRWFSTQVERLSRKDNNANANEDAKRYNADIAKSILSAYIE